MSEGFNIDNFLNSTLSEPNTRRPPIPAGTVLPGTFGMPEKRSAQGKKAGFEDRVFHFVDIPVEIDLTVNPSLREAIGQDKLILKYSFSVDLLSNGGLDMAKGKNNGLRQLRDALNKNNPGDTFSFMEIPGRIVLCKIGNRPYQGEVFDEIDSIARVG